MNNPNNVLITKKDVENILNFFGPINGKKNLKIKNLGFYQTAFTHESYHQSIKIITNEPIYINYLSNSSNEILEFLGDSVLKTCIGRYLYDRFGEEEREGFLTKLKIKIEKCSMLHNFAVNLGFKKFILLSLQIENQTILGSERGRETPAYYEDCFEAFLGAIMSDFGEKGYIYAERFVRNIIENVIDFSELISVNQNFKDSIQRYFQSQNNWQIPQYIELNKEGPLYRRIFTRILYINSTQYNELDSIQQNTIKNYTEFCLEIYLTENKKIYESLFEKISNGFYIISLGKSKKVISSEQECAKVALENLLLDLNY